MNITLAHGQQEWLEAPVKAGVYDRIDDAVATIIAEYGQLGLDDLDWAKPLIGEARASIERGEHLTLEQHRENMDRLIEGLKR